MLLIAGMFSHSITFVLTWMRNYTHTVDFDHFFKSDEEFISALGAAYTDLSESWEAMVLIGLLRAVSSDELCVPQRGGDW